MTYPPDNVAACCLIMKQCFNTFIMFNLTFKTMKRFLTMLMAVSAVFALNSCKEDAPVVDGPSVQWPSNSSFATVDITDDLDASLTVTAPAGIKSFVVSVDSDALESALGAIGITTTDLDLINDATVIRILDGVTQGQLPTGENLLNQTSVNFNISSLVHMINAVTTQDSKHSFTLNVTDNNAKTATVTCTFHRVGVDAPSMTWESNPDFATTEIETQMDVKIEISAPAGISSFVVGVNSGVLNPMISIFTGGSTDMDLINGPQALLEILSAVGIPTGDDLRSATKVSLDLSNLVPMIITTAGNPALGTGALEPDSDHVFTLNLTDAAGQNLTQEVTFHYTGVNVTLTDVNLWANTATVNIDGEATSVAYREKGAETWNELTAVDGAYTISPVWNDGTNDAGLTVYTLQEGTGIFAGKTYEIQVNGVTATEYTAGDGDVIPNGDMSQWSLKDGSLPYPNAEGESFWDSGNNSLASAFGANLCQEDPDNEGVAYLSANMVLGSVFAPGNMYTGDFIMSGVSGSANFGKVYDWTARPSALKLSYKAEVGVIDKNGSYDSEGESYLGQQDITRVYAVVIDWTAQHSVSSGLTEPAGMWDPATANSVEEGKIIGYASLNITENQADFTDVEIPFVWYDTEAKPASGNYSIVISCATSNRGDYLTGCSTNKLWVDNFEWVY